MISTEESENVRILRTVEFVTNSAGGVAVPVYIDGEATIEVVSVDGFEFGCSIVAGRLGSCLLNLARTLSTVAFLSHTGLLFCEIVLAERIN